MVKLIESSQFADVPDIGAKLAEFNSPAMSKEAETIFGRSYDSLKPTDDRFVGIHLTALGDEETYGPNRNFDSFPRESCIRYHDTFVKHGHVFSHHRNDASKDIILGTIKASAYNEKMHRVELFIWADKEKAKEGIDTLEKTGECYFSMACKVPWDQCSICGAKRKNSSDPNMCEHIRNGLGKVASNGKVAFMRNIEPDFFDISFVTKPADRIAYSLKVASDEVVTSEMLAKSACITAPTYLDPCLEADKRYTIRKLAERYDELTRQAQEASAFKSVAKSAAAELDDATINTLRKMTVKEAMSCLVDSGTFLSPDTFCKYAMGPGSAEYNSIKGSTHTIGKIASVIIKEAAWLGKFNLYKESCFDIDRFTSRPSRRFTDVNSACSTIKQASFSDDDNILRLIATRNNAMHKNASESIDSGNKICFNTTEKHVLASAIKYAEYKISAVTAYINGAGQYDTVNTNNRDTMLALIAAQDL